MRGVASAQHRLAAAMRRPFPADQSSNRLSSTCVATRPPSSASFLPRIAPYSPPRPLSACSLCKHGGRLQTPSPTRRASCPVRATDARKRGRDTHWLKKRSKKDNERNAMAGHGWPRSPQPHLGKEPGREGREGAAEPPPPPACLEPRTRTRDGRCRDTHAGGVIMGGRRPEGVSHTQGGPPATRTRRGRAGSRGARRCKPPGPLYAPRRGGQSAAAGAARSRVRRPSSASDEPAGGVCASVTYTYVRPCLGLRVRAGGEAPRDRGRRLTMTNTLCRRQFT